MLSTKDSTQIQKEKKIIGALAEKVWDAKTQQYHGGQEWKFINNFVEDFSVTTNGLGTPKHALKAAKEAVCIFFNIEFYKIFFIFIKININIVKNKAKKKKN